MQVPTVATRVPGCVDTIRDGITGLLVRPRDPEALAVALRYLLENPKCRERMGIAAREFVLRRFQEGRISQLLLNRYQNLLEAVRGGSEKAALIPDEIPMVVGAAEVRRQRRAREEWLAMFITEDQLAVEGGKPVRKEPFRPWPFFAPDEIDAATAVLRSGKINYWTGEDGRLFESEYAASVGTRYAIAVANGTLALELALYALGIGPGDEVIVTSRSFIGSASCVIARGAVPVFADVDVNSQNITAETIARVLTPRTKAIIPVHLAGWPCDMDSIMALASEKNLAVVEDCAQAHGATYKGRQVGSFGHINAFSFCQDKIISTGGEGGLVATNDKELWEKAWSYKDHGKSFDAVYNKKHPPGYRFLHESFGTNWRLTELQSALGRILLRKLPDHLAQRRRNAGVLSKHFSRVPGLRVPEPPSSVNHAYYKFYVFIRPEDLQPGWHLHRIQEAIIGEGIPCFAGYREMYLEKAFPSQWVPTSGMDNVTQLSRTSLVFPVHPTLGEADMLDTCRAVEKVMIAATSGRGQRLKAEVTAMLATRA